MRAGIRQRIAKEYVSSDGNIPFRKWEILVIISPLQKVVGFMRGEYILDLDIESITLSNLVI